MRKTILLAVMAFSFVSSTAQFSRMIVQFTDKNSTPYTMGMPQDYLSDRAIARRNRYSIGIDSTDLPIPPAYLNMVKAQGAVQVLSQSKWLNQVLIMTTDSVTVQKIRSLPFVKSAQSIAPIAVPVDNARVKNLDAVEPVLPLQEVTAQTTADVYNYGNSYNQIHIHLGEFLHNKGFSGQGMIITVLDAGFNNYVTNTAFDSIRMRGQVLGIRDFVKFDNSVTEDDTHGKNCLSIIAANWPGRMIGSASRASFWLVRTEEAATEFPVEEHNWVVGAEFADSCGTDLITSSLGYTTFDSAVFNHTYEEFYKNSTMITKGAALAVKKGMIVTNSAGNDGTATWKYLGFPADADSVCAVGAVNNAGTIASFSSYGYAGKQKPNVVSVGSGTVIAGTTGPTTGSGTSYSNPNMAGLITCLWQAFPRFNNMKILSALYASGNRSTSPDARYGYGLPNMKTAYRSLKKEENVILYGNDWMWTGAANFIDTLSVRFIGQVDGNASLSLLDMNNMVVAATAVSTQSFVTELEEVYNHTFSNLGALADGMYTVKYADSLKTRSLQVVKSGVLPLTALTVTATWLNNDASIAWWSAAPDAGYFNVLKSVNGTQFVAIGTVAAASGGQGAMKYYFNDKDARLATGSDIFYKIEVVDRNNRKKLSNVCRLPKQITGIRMALYPNPARTFVQVAITTESATPATLRIVNTHGQLIKQQTMPLAAGMNSLAVSLEGLPAGEYIISVKTNHRTLQDKFMLQ